MHKNRIFSIFSWIVILFRTIFKINVFYKIKDSICVPKVLASRISKVKLSSNCRNFDIFRFSVDQRCSNSRYVESINECSATNRNPLLFARYIVRLYFASTGNYCSSQTIAENVRHCLHRFILRRKNDLSRYFHRSNTFCAVYSVLP